MIITSQGALKGLAATQTELDAINAMYIAELGRPADASGLQYWATFYDRGYTGGDISAGIANSAEYAQVQSGTPAPTYSAPVAPVYPAPVVQYPVLDARDAWVQQTATPQYAPTAPVSAASVGGMNQKYLLFGAAGLAAFILLKKKKK